MLKKITVALIKWYRRDLSKRKHAPTCRFYPTCSAYALCAVEEYGVLGGLLLFFKRILRCHPNGGQGVDPVPIRHRKTSKTNTISPNPNRGYQILSLVEQQNRN